MKILIIGGTSFFGKEIVRCLDAAGHSVTIFTRGNVMPPDLARIPHIKGDRRVSADLQRAKALDRWDVVIDNVAYDAAAIKESLRLFEGVKQYIYTSSVSVYRYTAPRTTQPLVEEDVDFDYQPPSEDLSDVHWKYARGKMEAERELVRQDRTPWTIVRPSIVYGPSDVSERGFWYLARLMNGGPILLSNNGANTFRLAYSLDVAETYVELVSRPIAIGRIYNIACREIITLRDFIDESASILGLKPSYVPAPFEVLGEKLAGPYAYDRNWIPAIEAARKDLGFLPTRWTKAAEKSASWFRDCWKGDRAKLLAGRDAEIKFIEEWSKRHHP